MHGEYKRVPGGSTGDGRASAGDVPDCRPMGEAEPELRSHLHPVTRQEGEDLLPLLLYTTPCILNFSWVLKNMFNI